MEHMLPRTASAVVARVVGSHVALAQANLTIETSGPFNSPHLATLHLADVVGRAGIANL